jgi:hypothetical protein
VIQLVVNHHRIKTPKGPLERLGTRPTSQRLATARAPGCLRNPELEPARP